MNRPADKRFINFPLVMLAETLTDPSQGLHTMLKNAIREFAGHCHRSPEQALVQASYTAIRRKGDALPRAVKNILMRADVQEFCDGLEDAWGADAFEEVALAILDQNPVGLSDVEEAALVEWLALKDAASFFGRRILDFEGFGTETERARVTVNAHAETTGALVTASSPYGFFRELMDGNGNNTSPEAMRLFRMVSAVRSLVGGKAFTGTTKDMMRARMIGGKSPVVAETLASKSEAVRAELDALSSRKRFDRILTEGATRGFYVKLGAGRRVYLSLTAKDPEALAVMIGGRFNRQAAYRAKEAAARARLTGGGKGAPTGAPTGAALISLNSKNIEVRTSHATPLQGAVRKELPF